ncbi:MAG: hypothetical protein GWP08_02480 [Nitrospiraceae bacterium]|nr:hypothetical protein [Nitrospiraceae bacterium]
MKLADRAYVGAFPSSLDSAGRITMPSKFREQMKRLEHGKWWIGPGLNGNLYLYNRDQFEAMLQRSKSSYEAVDQETHGFFGVNFGLTYETRVDGQGRLLVPPALRELLGVGPKSEVVISGVQMRLELWEKQAWDAHVQQLWSSFGKQATELSAKYAQSGNDSEKGGREDDISAE